MLRVSAATRFDRFAENVGNVLNMEHINLTVPDQQLAALFYVTGLGFTRDPYMDFGTANMWVNAGAQQFHLPKGAAQRWRGHIAVVAPSLDDLERRLRFVAKPLAGTRFAVAKRADHIRVTCPWGNAIRAFGPERFPGCQLGIPEAEVLVAPGTARGIARFYEAAFATPTTVADDGGGTAATVSMGFGNQRLVYRETDAGIPAYDGHHIAIYVADFGAPHAFLARRGLVTEESDQHQYRFQRVVDADTGEPLAELEHEVRSLRHPMFKRQLVNRNPAQTFLNYREGRDAFYPE